MTTTRAQFMDRESFCVWIAAATSTGISLSNFNTLLTTLILVGTLIYTWRKALRRRKPQWPTTRWRRRLSKDDRDDGL